VTATLDRPAKILGKTLPRIHTPPLPENLYHGKTFYQKETSIRVAAGDLKPDRTHGFAAIKFARDMLGLTLFPWQEWLLVHALELVYDDNGQDVYRFRIVIVEVGRQNGKSLLTIILALWHLFSLHSRTVIGTAQDLTKADDTWREAVAYAEADEELSELFDISGIFQGHPKTFTLHDGCEYRVASATRRGGRGFSGDFILMDELREHSNWESWSAVTNTMNARPRGQCWAFSNAGDATSVVLRYQRALAHRDLGWPDGEREFDGVLDDIDPEIEAFLQSEGANLKPGWFEWSAPPTASRKDMDALAQSNPSLNHTGITDNRPTTRTLLAVLASAPAYEYETEVMCRWATMGLGGPFPEGSWAASCNPEARPAEGAQSVMCVEVSARRNVTYIARATKKEDGGVLVGMRYHAPGTEWALETIAEDANRNTAVVVRADTGGSTLSMLETLTNGLSGTNIQVLEWKSGDLNVATSHMFDLLRDFTPENRTIEHRPHTELDMAATSAVEALKPGGGWVIDIRRSPTDTAPLYAAIGAVWGLAQMEGADYDVLQSIL
jgi:hypothetical protein